MHLLKEQIKIEFSRKLDKLNLHPQYIEKSNLELQLNGIIETIVESLNLEEHIHIPIKKTTNDNIFDTVELTSDKSSEIELSDDFISKDFKEEKQTASAIPSNFKLTYEMEQFAKSKFVENVYDMFEDFKLYYQSKGILNQDWEAVWKRWVLNKNRYKNHLIKTTIDENMKLTSDMKKFASKYIEKDNIETEFLRFKNHYISNGDLKVSWEKVWENWCLQYKKFKPKQFTNIQTQQSIEKAAYKWDFKKAKDSSDRIKDWLEFEKGINWMEDFYLKDINIPGIGWQEVQHPDFNKEEILLYKIDSDNGQFMLEHKSNDILDIEVLEND